MKVIASIALTSGIVLTLVNTKFTLERLFSTNWGYTILIGATISIFVYVHILMQNGRSGKPTTADAASPSSLLMPSKSTLLRKYTKNTIIDNSQKRKIPKRFIPWLLFVSLTITVVLMVYASHGLF